MKSIAHNIYIHVPFCMSKCNYCAFFSHACTNPNWEQYTADICNEIKHWKQILGKINIPTIFFGGGTPSLIPVKSFEQIIKEIRTNFDLNNNTEITLESNPGTLNSEKLQGFINAGVNRLSIGVQSLDDKKLKFMGRRHDVQTALELINTAQEMGLHVSADFIYGLPGDTEETIIKLCEQINQLGLKHVSMYELTIEKNTPFGKMHLDMPDNETMAKMYTVIDKHLNLNRYEVSNYCSPGEQCKHNQNIWDGDAYIGIGRGAAGRIFLDNIWYEQRGNNEQFDTMTNDVRATEMILTGMRTIRGCRLTEATKNVIDMDWVKAHPEYVTLRDNRICATARGTMILDEIIVNIVR